MLYGGIADKIVTFAKPWSVTSAAAWA